MITLYNEKNEKIKLISAFEFNDADMGESFISATVSFDKEQNFHPDWYVVYNGEKFRLGVRKPTGKKDTSSLSTAYTLVFKSEREDLKRYTFMDFVELGSGNPQPSSYNVSLYATLSEFVDRFNTNLRYYMGSRWQMVLPDRYVEDGNAVSVSFDNASLWDVLLQVYEAFGVRWVIRSAGNVLQIQVGFQEVEIEHIFEYGKGNGLVSVERNNALERIITRLRGRGSGKNLPPDYFHTGDPDTNSFLQATFFKNLMPKSYRDYIRGYNAGSGTGSWAYNQGVADRVSGRNISPVDYAISDKEDLWGVSYGAIEPNEQIFPTLQGATRNGVRLDEVLAVEQVLVDGVREPQNTIAIGIGPAGQESSSGKCGDSKKNWYLEDCRDGIEFTILTDRFQVTNHINTAQIRITMSPSYIGDDGLPVSVEFGSASTVHSSAELQLVDFAGSANGEVIRSQTISDVDSYLWELDDIPAGDYRFKANVVWSADIQREGYDPTAGDVVVNIDTRLTGATVKEYARATDKGEFKETFDIEIRDVWGVTRNAGESDEDYTYRVWSPRAVSEDMTVMFSDGLLAGEDYEFRIVGFNSDADNLRQTIVSAIKPTLDGGWKLTLQKSDAELEAANIYLPNTMQNAKAGDHFFFVNISMPYDPYVYDAEERLLSYLDAQLALKDEEYPSFTITPSKIFCSLFAESDKIQAGAKIRVRNTALVGESYISLYIQSLTKRYSVNSLNPEWNLTLSDLVVASGNPVETLQGEVDILSQRVYNNRSAVQEAVRSLSSTFLRKDGIADVSYSPTEFKRQVSVGEGISDKNFVNGDISGKGFGVYTDGDGNRVVEADVIVGRIGARFNEVVINQVTYSAGKQVFSSAGMVVDRVEDVGANWRCYFDTKNATVRNYFVVGDGAFCQRFVDAGIRQYWARVVAIGGDYIDISKTDRMQGSFDPIVGDNIAQLGNKTDKSRQAALMIDETRDGGGLVTWYDDITDFTLSDKDSVNIGRIGGKTWLQVYGAGYIGDRKETQYVKYENGKVTIKGKLEIGTTLSDGRNLEEAINNAGGIDYLKEALKESTTVDGGLVQTSLLMLGYTNNGTFKVMSGTNGLYKSSEKGGGIAAWYGGPMADKEANSALVEYAQSLFRFDGSGYLAGGNITWDKDGAGSVAGGDIKWDKNGVITLGIGVKISGDENETLGTILNSINKLYSWFAEDADGNIYIQKNGDKARSFWTYGEISSGGLSDTESGDGSVVTIEQILTEGTPIANVIVNGVDNIIYAPENSGVSGDYLPLSGGTIEGTSASPFGVNSTDATQTYITIRNGGAGKAAFGYHTLYGTFMYNFASVSYLGVKDNGLPIYVNGGIEKELLHTENGIICYWANQNANDFSKSYVSFSYQNNTPDNGPIASFGVKSYGIQLHCAYGWDGDFYIRKFAPSSDGRLGSWHELIHSGNIGQYITGGGTPCLPLTGGTMTGSLVNTAAIVASYSNVDIAIEPKMGGINNYSGISFYKSGFKQGSIEANPLIINSISKGNLLIGTQANRGPKMAIHSLMGTGDMNRYNLYNSALLIGELDTHGYGLNFWTEGSGKGYIQQGRIDGSGTLYELVLQPFGGGVTVGGNFVATGEVTSGSDERYKRIESYAEIDIETIANAPIINFKWTDREDDKLHLGSTAQYWYNTSLLNGVSPADDDKLWTMGYGQIALASVVSVAKKVVNHEDRLQIVETELAYYKKKSQMLEQQLNEYRRA